jgi:hypothetical protein
MMETRLHDATRARPGGRRSSVAPPPVRTQWLPTQPALSSPHGGSLPQPPRPTPSMCTYSTAFLAQTRPLPPFPGLMPKKGASSAKYSFAEGGRM